MTQRLILTADAARRIVESGSETVLCDLQRIDPPRHVPPARGSWRCRFTNEGRWPIEPGEMVGITGMADSALSTAEAVENWRRRLASRLTMGGAFDIQLPKFEDKCAI
ncbi:MAG: hypothetical protein IJJ20_03595, partial [Thermoguttaceae bacterium]|nr:hypothetical protein [Thermoguttaceae bacterium]